MTSKYVLQLIFQIIYDWALKPSWLSSLLRIHKNKLRNAMATFHVALNDTDQYFEVKPHNFQNLAGWLPRMSIFVPFVVLLFSVFQAIFQKISQSVKYQVKGFFAVKVPEPFTELPSYPVIGPLLHLLCNRNG